MKPPSPSTPQTCFLDPSAAISRAHLHISLALSLPVSIAAPPPAPYHIYPSLTLPASSEPTIADTAPHVPENGNRICALSPPFCPFLNPSTAAMRSPLPQQPCCLHRPRRQGGGKLWQGGRKKRGGGGSDLRQAGAWQILILAHDGKDLTHEARALLSRVCILGSTAPGPLNPAAPAASHRPVPAGATSHLPRLRLRLYV